MPGSKSSLCHCSVFIYCPSSLLGSVLDVLYSSANIFNSSLWRSDISISCAFCFVYLGTDCICITIPCKCLYALKSSLLFCGNILFACSIKRSCILRIYVCLEVFSAEVFLCVSEWYSSCGPLHVLVYCVFFYPVHATGNYLLFPVGPLVLYLLYLEFGESNSSWWVIVILLWGRCLEGLHMMVA
jgi:hypothetical protein